MIVTYPSDFNLVSVIAGKPSSSPTEHYSHQTTPSQMLEPVKEGEIFTENPCMAAWYRADPDKQ